MFNNDGIKIVRAGAPTQILANVEFQFSMGVVVSDAGVTAGTDGRKIVKAGTPLSGDLDDRTTAFTTTGDAVGVLLHDVDVTEGAKNGTLLIFGFVNTNRLDDATKALITTAVKEALEAKVTFIAC